MSLNYIFNVFSKCHEMKNRDKILLNANENKISKML